MSFSHIDLKMKQETKETIDNYVEKGWEPGSFVRACLENNLRDAIGRADFENQECLKDIVCYLVWCIPAKVWGSPERVEQHLASFREKDETQ